MSFLFNSFLSLLAYLVQMIAGYFVDKIVTPISMGTKLFDIYFPMAKTYIHVFEILAAVLLVLIVIVQLLRGMLYKTANGETDHPVVLMMKAGVCLLLITTSIPVITGVLGIVSVAYTYSEDETHYFQVDAQNEGNIVRDGFNEFSVNVATAVGNASDWSASGALENPGIDDALEATIVTILIIVVAFNLLKFLLEVLERYLLLIVMLLGFPFAIATAPSVQTGGIFRKYVELIVSTILLCFLNMFFLRIVGGGLGIAFNVANNQALPNGATTNPIIGVFLILGMIRIAMSMDNHIARILTTATTGSGLGWEVTAALTGMAISGSRVASGLSHAFGGRGSSQSFGQGKPGASPGSDFKDGSSLRGSGGVGTTGKTTPSGQSLAKSQAAQALQDSISKNDPKRMSECIGALDGDDLKQFAATADPDNLNSLLNSCPDDVVLKYFDDSENGEALLQGFTPEMLEFDEQGNLQGFLSDGEGNGLEFRTSDFGEPGAVLASADDGSRFITMDDSNGSSSYELADKMVGGFSNSEFTRSLVGNDVGSNSISGNSFEVPSYEGVVKGEKMNFGSLSFDAASLTTMVPEINSLQAGNNPGSYKAFDANKNYLGEIKMVLGTNPSENVNICGNKANYSFKPAAISKNDSLSKENISRITEEKNG